MKKIILSGIVACLLSFYSLGQQARNYSMWFKNNMQYNAAAVGSNDNNLRLFTNFRYQYFTVMDKPFQTISASLEGKLLKSRLSNGYIGAGVSFMNDMSGDGRYAVSNLVVPVAYHLEMNRDHHISLGLQAGFYQRSINAGNLTWENQWNGYEFNTSITGEGIPNASVQNFDMGAGVMYRYQPDNTNKLIIGYGANHVVRPELSFNIQDELFMQHTIHIGGSIKGNLSAVGFSPNALIMLQGPNRNVILGSNFDFYLQEPSLRTDFFQPTIFTFGIYHRYLDAIIANFMFSWKGLTAGLSYDSNISLLPNSSSVGALEVVLLYDIDVNRRNKYIR
jgi:type IX secretion system PorP/SprF family membrane protein